MDIFGLGAAVAPGLTKIVGDVLNRILPAEKMSEADKLRLQSEVQLAVMAADWKQVETEFSDRASARVLAASDVARGNAFSNVLAATVRPVWGYCSLVVVAYPYLAGALGWGSVSIDDNTKSIVQTVIMFYFGGRTIEKMLPMIKGK